MIREAATVTENKNILGLWCANGGVLDGSVLCRNMEAGCKGLTRFPLSMAFVTGCINARRNRNTTALFVYSS